MEDPPGKSPSRLQSTAFQMATEFEAAGISGLPVCCGAKGDKVSLLTQEVLVGQRQSTVEAKLRNCNETMTFEEQTTGPSASPQVAANTNNYSSPSCVGSESQKVPVQKMVRIDSPVSAGRLHAYMQAKLVIDSEKITSLTALRCSIRQRINPKEASDLTSIQELVKEIDSSFN